MEAILADLEKKMASVKITVMSAKDKDKVIKNGIWFGSKRHPADSFTGINPDRLSTVCCHWGYITLKLLNMDRPRCQLYAGPHMTGNHKCEVN